MDIRASDEDRQRVVAALERQYRHLQIMNRKSRRVSFVRERTFPEFYGLLSLRTEAEALPPELLQTWGDLAHDHRQSSRDQGRRGRRRRR